MFPSHRAEQRGEQGAGHTASRRNRLTEETDAIAIIVSEETGAISMATAGKLETAIDMENLRNRLTDIFTTAQRRKIPRKSPGFKESL